MWSGHSCPLRLQRQNQRARVPAPHNLSPSNLSPPIAAKQPSADFLSHRFRLSEEIEIVRPAGFRIGARHVEPAERMRADHGARALAVDVQVADVEFLDRTVNLVA